MHSVSVAGVAIDDAGRVLLIRRRDNDQWQAPGGVLELGETFEAGVRREVLEETGIEVEVEALTGVYKNMSLGVVALVYKCRAIGGTPSVSNESIEVAWVALDDALGRMSEVFGVRVRDAASGEPSGRPASRSHDGIRLLR